MTAAENMRKVLGESGVYRLDGETPLDWELAAYGAELKDFVPREIIGDVEEKIKSGRKL